MVQDKEDSEVSSQEKALFWILAPDSLLYRVSFNHF